MAVGCNECLSPMKVSFRFALGGGVLDTTVYNKVWPVTCDRSMVLSGYSSTNKTDLHDIAEILLKVSLNTITLTLTLLFFFVFYM